MRNDSTGRISLRGLLLSISAAAWLLLALRRESMDMSAWATLAGWLLMLAATMLPLLVGPMQHIRAQSFRQRHLRSAALFLIGYLTVWMLAGTILLLPGRFGMPLMPSTSAIAATACLPALVWHCSPARQRCLNRCHRLPTLAAFGTAADASALGFGVTHGLWCAASCGAWMLVPMLLPAGQLAAMVPVSAMVLAERFEPGKRPAWELRLPRAALNAAQNTARRRLVPPSRQAGRSGAL